MKKILSLLLVLVMALSMLAACNNGSITPTDTTVNTPAEPPLTVVADGASRFRIVYNPKEYDGSNLLQSRIKALNNALKSRTGVTLETLSSWEIKEKSDDTFDILIGNTGFAASAAALEDLRQKDYCIIRSGNKIVINAHSIDLLSTAVSSFTSKVVNEQTMEDGKTTVIFGVENNIIYRYNYKGANVKIAGTPIGEYAIVYPFEYDAAEYEVANIIKQEILDICGVELPVFDDGRSHEHEIRIGKTARSAAENTAGKTEYTLNIEQDGTLQIYAGSQAAYYKVPDNLSSKYLSTNTDINVLTANIDKDLKNVGDALLRDPGELRVIFHNIYGNESPGDGIATNQKFRYKLEAALYADYGADFVCLQEFTTTSRNNGAPEAMKKAGYTEIPAYAGKFEVGKYSGKGGYPKTIDVYSNTPVFYNAEKYELVKYGHLIYKTDYSDNMRYTSASKSATWGIFRDKASGKVFAIISTHFDHQNDADANKRRISECKELLTEINTNVLVGEYANIPLIMGGDLNSSSSREEDKYGNTGALTELGKAGYTNVQFTFKGAEDTQTNIGYPHFDKTLGYFTTVNNIKGTLRGSIDHSYYKGGVAPVGFDVINNDAARRTSDHMPVLVDYNFS